MMPNGKHRAKAQRIGSLGEAVFRLWAEDHDLIPNKLEHDYGIDFICQRSVAIVANTSGTHEVSPSALACQVKAAQGRARPRASLDRRSATALLQLEVPTCIFAVDLDRRHVCYRFRNERLIDELAEFLASGNASKSWPLTEFDLDDGEFAQALADFCRPATQARLHAYALQRSIELELPGLELELLSTIRESSALCSLPWLGSAFTVEAGFREQARQLVLADGIFPKSSESGIILKGAFDRVWQFADKITLAGAFEVPRLLTIRVGDESASLLFTTRTLDDDLAFVHPVGLCLIGSAPSRRALRTRIRSSIFTK